MVLDETFEQRLARLITLMSQVEEAANELREEAQKVIRSHREKDVCNGDN